MIKNNDSLDQYKVAEEIKEYREKNSMTRQQLSDKISVPTFTIYRWEKMKVSPSPVMIRELKRFGIIK